MRAASLGDGVSVAYVKDEAIRFDSSPEQSASMPGPADLMAASFAACILKNVERMSGLMPFRYHDAEVEVTAERQDAPPKMIKIYYVLRVSTDEPQRRVDFSTRTFGNTARSTTRSRTYAKCVVRS